MAKQNFAIYERLRDIQRQGAQDIYSALVGNPESARSTGLSRIKRLLPPGSAQGLFARLIWRQMRALAAGLSVPAPADSDVLAQLDALSLHECDVLVQVDNFEAGGLENVVIDLSETLIKAGYSVVLLVLGTPGRGVQQAQERGVPVITGSPEDQRYRELINLLKPRLLITHYSLHGAECCHELNIPFVQVIHNTYMWFDDAQRAAFAHAARFTTVFVAVSEYAKHYSVRRLELDENHCLVIPNGIDSATFDSFDSSAARLEIRAKHGLNDSDFVFLSVGAINHQKNHIAAVRAFSTVADALPDAKLVILGPAYEKGLLEQIEQFVAAQKLTGRVIYAGAVAGAQKYYAMADAFVSTAFFEGGPLNQLEAVRANLPCIMTDIGFAGYFKGRPGFEIVAPPLDITEFCGAIWQLESTPEFEKRIAAAMARTYQSRRCPDLPQHILDAFDKSNAYRCYVELIEDLLRDSDVRGKKFPNGWPDRLAAAAAEHDRAAG